MTRQDISQPEFFFAPRRLVWAAAFVPVVMAAVAFLSRSDTATIAVGIALALLGVFLLRRLARHSAHPTLAVDDEAIQYGSEPAKRILFSNIAGIESVTPLHIGLRLRSGRTDSISLWSFPPHYRAAIRRAIARRLNDADHPRSAPESEI